MSHPVVAKRNEEIRKKKEWLRLAYKYRIISAKEFIEETIKNERRK